MRCVCTMGSDCMYVENIIMFFRVLSKLEKGVGSVIAEIGVDRTERGFSGGLYNFDAP